MGSSLIERVQRQAIKQIDWLKNLSYEERWQEIGHWRVEESMVIWGFQTLWNLRQVNVINWISIPKQDKQLWTEYMAVKETRVITE